jgi:hypothetical protein
MDDHRPNDLYARRVERDSRTLAIFIVFTERALDRGRERAVTEVSWYDVPREKTKLTLHF